MTTTESPSSVMEYAPARVWTPSSAISAQNLRISSLPWISLPWAARGSNTTSSAECASSSSDARARSFCLHELEEPPNQLYARRVQAPSVGQG